MGAVEYYYTEPDGFELVLSRGQARSYPWHMHTQHWTVGVVRHGSVMLTTRTGPHAFEAGQSFFIRPLEPHSLRVETNSSLLVACLDANSFLSGEKNAKIPLLHNVFLQPEDIRSVEEALAVYAAQAPASAQPFPLLTGHGSLCSHAIQEIMQQIQDAPEESLSIQQMAAYAGYSQWYFLRTFQKSTGLTPHAFQLLCRLRVLRSMLRADTTAVEAAVSAGFTDQSHMHKVFKHHHGLTPGAFRKASIKLVL